MNKYLDTMLMGITKKLQLSDTLYQQADERYKTIAKTIQDDSAFEHITLHIYPQGSFRLKTTVKPFGRDEYDLDFVAELPMGAKMTPQSLYDHIYRILSHDGIHDKMIEKKSRCIRVNYANAFHIDIMPGKLANPSTKEIIVPDRELKLWYHKSNPIGFADWFETQAKTHIAAELAELNAVRKTVYSADKLAEKENVEDLEPLRRAVQLVKRYRDVYCNRYNTEPVRSIVICTLMGKIAKFTGGTMQIILSFCEYVNGLIEQNHNQPFEVRNPAVEEEVLTEKWFEGNNFRDFVSMMKSLTSDVQRLNQYRINGDINQLLKIMFGETLTDTVIKEIANPIGEARKSGNLSIDSSGRLQINQQGIPVKKNTFYGDAD